MTHLILTLYLAACLLYAVAFRIAWSRLEREYPWAYPRARVAIKARVDVSFWWEARAWG